MSLKVYNRKRKFSETPEPKGEKPKVSKGALKFVVQLHRASRLHYDFRLEFGGVLKSWAVPKGPSLNPLDQRLAVYVEDHPIKYGSFEGIIPKGNYGAGTVMIWDEGTYHERSSETRADSEKKMAQGLEKGHLTFVLNGEKLKGEFALIRLKRGADDKPWLLVKKRDEHSTYKRDSLIDDLSVKTGRTMNEIAGESEKDGDVWLPKRPSKKTVPKPAPASLSPASASEPMPRKIKPMVAIKSRNTPAGKNWLFEKYDDGLRAIAEVEKTRAHLYSKSQLSFDQKYPQILAELKSFKDPMVLDGTLSKKKGVPFYNVSDILYFKGRDLRDEKLKERRRLLEEAIPRGKHVGIAEKIKAPKEGDIVWAKNLDSQYHSGTSSDWLQIEFSARPVQMLKTEAKTTPKAKQKRITTIDSALAEPRLTHLDKIYFPEDKITKGDLIEYYKSISSFILPHLKDKPESLNRHPNGINAAGFYQKDMTGYSPRWLKTERIFSESGAKTVNYVVCQDLRSLLYIVNLGCIEINPWFSRVGHLDKPDYLVIDLDPDGNPFTHVIEIAHEVHKILEAVGAQSFVKTSGATGIHIAVPTGGRYDFDTGRDFAEAVCKIIAKKYPATTSIERNPNRRRKKIYLDFMQNRRGQTLAAPYCVRPHARAPVSMPIQWRELTPRVKPADFNIENAARRVHKLGDLWSPVLKDSVDLLNCFRTLTRKFSKN